MKPTYILSYNDKLSVSVFMTWWTVRKCTKMLGCDCILGAPQHKNVHVQEWKQQDAYRAHNRRSGGRRASISFSDLAHPCFPDESISYMKPTAPFDFSPSLSIMKIVSVCCLLPLHKNLAFRNVIGVLLSIYTSQTSQTSLTSQGSW